MRQLVAPGQRFGPYELMERIGHGGSAVVYKAYHARLDRHVAVKIIAASYAADDTFRARFSQEAQLIARLRHRHVLQVFESGETQLDGHDIRGGVAYLATEYMAGGNLAGQLGTVRTPQERCLLALQVVQQIGAALDCAHASGVLHRDVKPSNILIASDGRLVLGDFGMARVLQDGASLHLTTSGLVAGTPVYMAPEQALGEPADSRTDLYGLAVVLYEIVAGRVPFQAETPLATMLAHVHQPPPAPRQLNAAVPLSVDAVLLRALAKVRAERYQSATQLSYAMRRAVVQAYGEAAVATSTFPCVAFEREAVGWTSLWRGSGSGLSPGGTFRRMAIPWSASRRRSPYAGRAAPAAMKAATAVLVATAITVAAALISLAAQPSTSATASDFLLSRLSRPSFSGLLAWFSVDAASESAPSRVVQEAPPIQPVQPIEVPGVTDAWPPIGARNQPLRPMVTLRFSHPMDQQSVREALRLEPEALVDLEWAGQLLVVRSQRNLEPGTDYVLIIEASAKNVHGHTMGDTVERRFTTLPVAEVPQAPSASPVATPAAITPAATTPAMVTQLPIPSIPEAAPPPAATVARRRPAAPGVAPAPTASRLSTPTTQRPHLAPSTLVADADEPHAATPMVDATAALSASSELASSEPASTPVSGVDDSGGTLAPVASSNSNGRPASDPSGGGDAAVLSGTLASSRSAGAASVIAGAIAQATSSTTPSAGTAVPGQVSTAGTSPVPATPSPSVINAAGGSAGTATTTGMARGAPQWTPSATGADLLLTPTSHPTATASAAVNSAHSRPGTNG